MSRSVRLTLGLIIMCAIGYFATIIWPPPQQKRAAETKNEDKSVSSDTGAKATDSPQPHQAPLSILYNIGDHRYALCHRYNKHQVSQHDIEDLMLIREPANSALIKRQGDPVPATSPNALPSGWVMLLDHNNQLQRALERLNEGFDLSEQ